MIRIRFSPHLTMALVTGFALFVWTDWNSHSIRHHSASRRLLGDQRPSVVRLTMDACLIRNGMTRKCHSKICRMFHADTPTQKEEQYVPTAGMISAKTMAKLTDLNDLARTVKDLETGEYTTIKAVQKRFTREEMDGFAEETSRLAATLSENDDFRRMFGLKDNERIAVVFDFKMRYKKGDSFPTHIDDVHGSNRKYYLPGVGEVERASLRRVGAITNKPFVEDDDSFRILERTDAKYKVVEDTPSPGPLDYIVINNQCIHRVDPVETEKRDLMLGFVLACPRILESEGLRFREIIGTLRKRGKPEGMLLEKDTDWDTLYIDEDGLTWYHALMLAGLEPTEYIRMSNKIAFQIIGYEPPEKKFVSFFEFVSEGEFDPTDFQWDGNVCDKHRKALAWIKEQGLTGTWLQEREKRGDFGTDDDQKENQSDGEIGR